MVIATATPPKTTMCGPTAVPFFCTRSMGATPRSVNGRRRLETTCDVPVSIAIQTPSLTSASLASVTGIFFFPLRKKTKVSAVVQGTSVFTFRPLVRPHVHNTCAGASPPGRFFSEYDSADSGVASDQGPERWRSIPGRDEARGNSGVSPKRLWRANGSAESGVGAKDQSSRLVAGSLRSFPQDSCHSIIPIPLGKANDWRLRGRSRPRPTLKLGTSGTDRLSRITETYLPSRGRRQSNVSAKWATYGKQNWC